MIRNPYKNAWLEINHEGESGNSAVQSTFQHCEIHRCGADGEAALTFSKTWFPIFAVLVSVSCFACCVIFGTRIFFVVVVRDFRKPELHGSQFAQPLFTVCRWKSCQFAAQSFGSLLITTSALCTQRNDADVFGWHTASLREVLQAAEYLLWDTEALSMLQNWASNEACLLHAFSK